MAGESLRQPPQHRDSRSLFWYESVSEELKPASQSARGNDVDLPHRIGTKRSFWCVILVCLGCRTVNRDFDAHSRANSWGRVDRDQGTVILDDSRHNAHSNAVSALLTRGVKRLKDS